MSKTKKKPIFKSKKVSEEEDEAQEEQGSEQEIPEPSSESDGDEIPETQEDDEKMSRSDFDESRSVTVSTQKPSFGTKQRGRPKKEGGEKKRKKSAKPESYSYYIYKILREVHPDLRISKIAMETMNSFVMDMFERLAQEGSKLCTYGKTRTLSSREIETAAKLLLPGELGVHANNEARKALATYAQRTVKE